MMLSRDVCRIHFCVQVHARASEGKIWEKWLAPASTYWTGFFLLFPHGDCDWRFVCFLSRRLAAAGNMGSGELMWIRSCISPLDHNRKKDQLRHVCVCVTLGRSSFGEEFLTFQPTTVVPTSDPVTNTGLDWTGLEIWKSPFSDLNPMAGMRLSMTLASSPQPAARWELGLPVRMSRGCGSPFAVLRLDLL
jgi:hypothetical protein